MGPKRKGSTPAGKRDATRRKGVSTAAKKRPASTADVKARVESLIEREYLERDPRDAGVYNYLA